MKNLLLILFVISLLVSCGPHRMSCGARGICKASQNQISPQNTTNQNLQILKIIKKPV